MPDIPDFDPQVDVRQTFTPSVSAGALAAPGEALQHGAGELSDVMNEFTARYVDARRHADATNIIANTGNQLADLRFKYGKVPDRAAALAGFDKDAGALVSSTIDNIKDPFLRDMVSANLAATAAGRRVETGDDAFKLESSRRVGEVDTNLSSFAQQAAATSDPLLRGKIVDDGTAAIRSAVSAGWLDPAAGAERELRWKSQVQEVQVRNLIDHVAETQNPADAHALSLALNDSKQFPGLDPDTRDRLTYKVDGITMRLETRAIAAQAHSDAVAERGLHQAQAHNETTILGAIYNGKTIDPNTLEKLADGQAISPSGLEAIHSALTRQAEGTDDARTTVSLWHMIDTNQAKPDDIYKAINSGALKGSTGAEMMRTIDKGEETPAVRGKFDILKTALHGQAIELGTLDAPQATANYAAAQAEWHRRIASGENADAVLSDMAPHYAKNIAHPNWLAPTALGVPQSTNDARALGLRLGGMLKAHQISQAQFESQGALLTEYLHFYQLHDKATAALGSVGSAPAKPSTPEASP